MEKLLLLSGLCTDETIWLPQSKALSRDYDVTIIHFNGLDSLEAMAEKVIASCEGDFYLAGISMGGWVAQKVACMVPERIKGMVLINTWMYENAAAVRVGDELLAKLEAGPEKYDEVVRYNITNSFCNIEKVPSAVVNSVCAMKKKLGCQIFKDHLLAVMQKRCFCKGAGKGC